MDAPNNPTFWRPRSDLIRECVAAGLPTSAIRERCIAEGYFVDPETFYQAVYSARKHAGVRVPERPSYYHLCKEYVRAFRSAYESGKVLGHTREMQNLITAMEANLIHDQDRPPRRRKNKKRAKAK